MSQASPSMATGPLRGLKIIEFAGVGPNPFCAMLLADMGAEVVTVDRVSPHGLGIKKEHRFNPTTRSRRSISVDLKSARGRELALRLLEQAEACLESNRPGVMERLGLGPEDCWKVNPKLVYGRSTGWGQNGPLSNTVGHDLNFLALSGLLSMIGPPEGAPAIPLNLLGDYAGGGLYLALGVLAAVFEARLSGIGQVVDAAMIDGLGSLMTHQFGFLGSGSWLPKRGANFLDGGAPWYNVYRTSDGGYISAAPIEPKFYSAFLTVLGLEPSSLPDQMDRDSWPALRSRFAEIFATRSRDEWCRLFEGVEACVAPVLSVAEALEHPHQKSRGGFIEIDGVVQPAPAPRFSRTVGRVSGPPPVPGSGTNAVLQDWGLGREEIAALRQHAVIT
ncbi:MAG: CaiB/BaiF CoA-transferase family protein [Novosphingobium sp.]|nr:CaiB/BaiF CoA-transferase family protein [Novosphingobium sp.]